jgi:hypothetical protein
MVGLKGLWKFRCVQCIQRRLVGIENLVLLAIVGWLGASASISAAQHSIDFSETGGSVHCSSLTLRPKHAPYMLDPASPQLVMHDIASLPPRHMSCVADRIYSDYA